MAWLNLKEEIEDMFSILNVPEFRDGYEGFTILDPEKKQAYMRDYLREYRKRPEVKAAEKTRHQEYSQRPEAKARARERARARQAQRTVYMRAYRQRLRAQNARTAAQVSEVRESK